MKKILITLGLVTSALIFSASVALAKKNTPSRATAAERTINIPQNQDELARKCQAELEAKVPENIRKEYMIYHKAMTISYNFTSRTPNWVYHEISKRNLENSCVKRSDSFDADPLLIESSLPAIGKKDYARTGFDRGHMAPSADFAWDKQINSESFFMTNMTPQTPNLNQRAWEKLEERIRRWACAYGELKIYTGPVLKNDLKRLDSCVSVPEEFFKIIVYYKDDKYHGIGFIYNQEDNGDPYKERAVPIRSIELKTGIDFFKDKLSPKVQDEFEKFINWSDWENDSIECKKCPSQPQTRKDDQE